MGQTITDIMYLIAKKANDLNKSGEVKGFGLNEIGYAKIFELKRGCSFWVHHLSDDILIIDLMISEAARKRYPTHSEFAEKKCYAFFKEMRMPVKSEPWLHGMGGAEYQRYFVDVSSLSFNEISQILDNMVESLKRPL